MRFLARGHSSTIYTLDDTHHEQACGPRRGAAALPKACRRHAFGIFSVLRSHPTAQHTDLHPPPTRRHTHTEEQGLSLNREPFLKRGISLNQGFLEIDLKRKISFFLEKSILISKILLRKKLNVLTSYSYSALLLSYSLTSLHLTSSHLTSSHLTIPCTFTLTLT